MTVQAADLRIVVGIYIKLLKVDKHLLIIN